MGEKVQGRFNLQKASAKELLRRQVSPPLNKKLGM
jgi:hypothetical protein